MAPELSRLEGQAQTQRRPQTAARICDDRCAAGQTRVKVTLPNAPETAVRIDINSLPFEAKSGSKVVLSYWAKIEGQPSGAQNFGIVVRPKAVRATAKKTGAAAAL
jgi:hypothetical protein